MFARFRTDEGKSEVNVNITLVRDFVPSGEDSTKINFLGGDSMIVPETNRSVRSAFKRAMTEHQRKYPDSKEA
jgi:hypothetical protein